MTMDNSSSENLSNQNLFADQNPTNTNISREEFDKIVSLNKEMMQEIQSLKSDPIDKANKLENDQAKAQAEKDKISMLSRDNVQLETDLEKYLTDGGRFISETISKISGEEEKNKVIMRYVITKITSKYSDDDLKDSDYSSLKRIYSAEIKDYAQKNDPKRNINLSGYKIGSKRQDYEKFLMLPVNEKIKQHAIA